MSNLFDHLDFEDIKYTPFFQGIKQDIINDTMQIVATNASAQANLISNNISSNKIQHNYVVLSTTLDKFEKQIHTLTNALAIAEETILVLIRKVDSFKETVDLFRHKPDPTTIAEDLEIEDVEEVILNTKGNI